MILETYNEPVANGRDLRRLAGAVLTQAITDLRAGIPHQQREASHWIFEGDSGVITFNTCCDHLDRDPSRVRKKIVEAFGLPRNIVDTFGSRTRGRATH
jgi:hypothetical protein